MVFHLKAKKKTHWEIISMQRVTKLDWLKLPSLQAMKKHWKHSVLCSQKTQRAQEQRHPGVLQITPPKPLVTGADWRKELPLCDSWETQQWLTAKITWAPLVSKTQRCLGMPPRAAAAAAQAAQPTCSVPGLGSMLLHSPDKGWGDQASFHSSVLVLHQWKSHHRG